MKTPNLGVHETGRRPLERIRRKLAGSDDGDRQLAEILSVVLSDGLPAVEEACDARKTAALLDRLTHHCDIVETGNES